MANGEGSGAAIPPILPILGELRGRRDGDGGVATEKKHVTLRTFQGDRRLDFAEAP